MRKASQAADPPWDIFAQRIDDFAAAWDAAASANADPPRLDAFLADLDPTAARQLAVELAKLDIERRWEQNRQPQHIEWYLQQYPLLAPIAQLPVDLIYEELQARMAAGLPVYQEEVQQRFPGQARSLLQLLGGMALSGSPTATYYGDTVVDKKAPPKPRPTLAPFTNLKPGDQLDDFQLLTPLGSGAFARVFLARQVSMERLVALKVSAHSGSEPQTLAQLDHPHIVRVYDQRHSVQPPANLLYMEVVSGGTLQDIVARARNSYDGQASGELLLNAIDDRLSAVGTPIPESSSSRDWIEEASWPDVVCRLGAELSEGLAYAHSRGVLHRDIKPANVLLSAEARPKLADFNVSYNGGRADENPEDTFGGSLAYMSPEQLEACHPLLGGTPRSVRESSDVYAVGVMLWELLAGRRPFRDEQLPEGGGGSLVRLQRMIETRRQANFIQLAEQLPEGCPASVREVLTKCLQPEKGDRYQSAGELSRALQMCLNPRCWQLLQPPRTILGRLALTWPILAMVLAGLIPNIMTAVFNFIYNEQRIKVELSDLWQRFWDVQWWINGIAFPVGVTVGAWAAMRMQRMIKSDVPFDRLEGSRHVLMFGRFISLLLLTLWVVSAFAFPIAVGWDKLSGLPTGFYIHFFLSLALCGCGATAYPYFLITAMATHYFIPAMMRSGAIAGPRRRDLKQVLKLNGIHLIAAAAVPLLGVLLIAIALFFAEHPEHEQRWPLIVVSAGGLAWLAIVMSLKRMIELDVAALDQVAIDEPRHGGGGRSSRGSGGSSRRRSAR
ncbi:MAG: serine/threonine protein kinase [Pirellulales bacterium]|nr:serine/threonine protein kinase [Pirellulales bacterium]